MGSEKCRQLFQSRNGNANIEDSTQFSLTERQCEHWRQHTNKAKQKSEREIERGTPGKSACEAGWCQCPLGWQATVLSYIIRMSCVTHALSWLWSTSITPHDSNQNLYLTNSRLKLLTTERRCLYFSSCRLPLVHTNDLTLLSPIGRSRDQNINEYIRRSRFAMHELR